jgi:hypothetical protein
VSFGRALALIAAGGLAARLVYVLVVMDGVGVAGDGLQFHILANQLAAGDGYIQPLVVSPDHVATADKPPLYPLLLALPSLAGWDSITAQRVLSCLMGAALVAGAPLLVVLDGALRSESLYAPLVAFALLAAYRLKDRPTLGRAAALGALGGAAALTRSEAVLLLVLLVAAVVLRLPGGWRGRLRVGAVALGAAALVLAPWVIRNWAEFERPLLSTNSGSLAYGANCHDAYFTGLIGSWPCYPPLRVEPGEDEADVAAALRRTGVDYAREHAGRLPAVAAARLLRSFDLWAPRSATRLEAGIGDRNLAMHRAGVLVYWLLVPLAILGAVLLRRRGEPLLLLLVPVLVVAVVSVAGYGTPRFRVPAEIPLVVLAAVALATLTRGRRPRGAAASSPASDPRRAA